MKLSKILTSLLLFIVSATYAQRTPQDTLTAYYFKYPQEAIKEAGVMYREGIKNKNTPLLIKSLILKNTFTIAINPDEYPAVLSQLEKYISQESDLTSKAILNSYCAQLYVQYYNHNRFVIEQRTSITDYIPEELESWSSNLFTEKIIQHAEASLVPADQLQKSPLQSYKAILTPLTSSDSLRPTLYDFLCYRAMNILSQTESPDFKEKHSDSPLLFAPVAEFIEMSIPQNLRGQSSLILQIWQKLLLFRKSSSDISAFLSADLDRLEYAKKISSSEEKNTLYLQALQALQKQYKNTPFIIEVMAREADEYKQTLFKMSYNREVSQQQLIAQKEKIIHFCENGIRLYPKYKRINLLHAIVSEMRAPYLSLQIPEVIYPGDSLSLKLTSQNLDNITLQIDQIDLNTEAYEKLENPDKNKAQHKIYEKRYPLYSSLVKRDTLIRIVIPQAGLYKISLNTSSSKRSVSRTFTATRLFSNNQYNTNHQIYTVCDWKSGKPISNAQVRIYKPTYPGYTLIDSTFTNSRGMAFSSQKLSKQNLAYQVINSENPNGPIDDMYRRGTTSTSETQTVLITDRKIYRPGQTVYYKGISWKATQDTLYTLEGQKYQVSFLNANNKEIAQQETTSNRYGSFTGSFVIPTQTLNGYFTLRTAKGETYIQVASYKRPEFEISFTKPEQTYFMGDKIHLQGQVNSFSGVKLANTEIHYDITVYSPFYYFPRRDSSIHGVTRSNANGNFEITFQAQSISPSPSARNSYIYEINAKVTDDKGDTQETSTFIPIYSGKATPTLEIPTQVNKLQPTAFHISLQEISNDTTPYLINYMIRKIVAPKQLSTHWELTDTIFEKTVQQGHLSITRQDSIFPDLSQQPSGIYLFTATNNHTEANQIFYLYSPMDRKPSYPTYRWLVKEKTVCHPGETARILFGTSVKNAYVRYDVYTSKKLIKRAYPILSDEIIPIDIPYKAEYGDQIWLYITYVKDQTFISEIIPIKKVKANRELTIETKTFRDKLTPGQSETWKIRVVDASDQPVTAELLAMMYDASLDKITPYDLDFHPNYLCPGEPYSLTSSIAYIDQNSLHLYDSQFKRPVYPVAPINFSQLQTYESPKSFYRFSTRALEDIIISATGSARPNAMVGSAKSMSKEIVEDASQLAETASTQINYRENFQETAFFYPQLQTDAEGYADISFIVPETTTRWKFTALATTPQLFVGQLFRTIVTSKPLLVRPNLPRFLRAGDQTEIKVTVSNLSTTLQEGKADFELFAPNNKKILIHQSQDFNLQIQGSQTLSFQFTVPEDTDLIGFRISAQSGNFSDGEQHLLPILPAETLITQTLPIYSNQLGSHTYSLKRPETVQQNYRLTFELSANPIWYAVLAIPAVQEPQNENITDLSAAYYVNCIAQHIIKANPEIAEIIRQWHLSPDDPTLLSKLEQNQELKSILLEASPWVMQAQSESERMQKLAQLFDQNRLNYLQENILQKLTDLQNPTGGWSWFKGMYPSRFMTANVLAIMARANLTGQQSASEQEKNMQIKALRYWDKEIQKDYQTTPKYIQYDQILYLHVRSLYRDIPLGDALKAHKYFLSLAQKQWSDFDLYEKALTVITLNRYGFKQEALNILKSLRQYAITDPNLGMYWPNNRNHHFKNSSIQVHVALMEAFYELEGATPDTELMKQWLLRQKQTQSWGNTPSTVDAIYALLLTGKDQLNQSEEVTVKIGQQELTSSSNLTPLGYIKKTYTAAEIQPDMLNVEITKKTDTPSWGGLYLQYFERFDQIEKQKGDLRVDKKLFIEKVASNGSKELTPLDQQSLQTGDKVIIRLTLSLKRDMDFLYLKDFRAACFEPVNQTSGNEWKFGTVYYEETKDAVTNFFFNALSRGTYVLEYPVWVNQAGTYQDGIAIFQSMYVPEYTAYSKASKITVED